MPNTENIPVVLYDDSGAGSSEEKYQQSVKSIKRFLTEKNPPALVEAVNQVLAG